MPRRAVTGGSGPAACETQQRRMQLSTLAGCSTAQEACIAEHPPSSISACAKRRCSLGTSNPQLLPQCTAGGEQGRGGRCALCMLCSGGERM